MAYDHVIAYPLITSYVFYVELMRYNLAAIELWHTKWNLHIMRGFIRARSRVVLDFVSPQFGLIRIYVLTLYHSVVRSNLPQKCYT